MAGEGGRRPRGAPDIIDEINELLRLGVGDQYRLEHIKLAYVENRTIWESDRRYLERMREKYVADLRRGEPVDDDRDVAAATGPAPRGPAGGAPAPEPGPAAAAATTPDTAAVPDPSAAPGRAPPPAAAPPGSPESAASDAEDFGADPDATASDAPAVIHCWKCGKKNLLKANFCMRCGVLLFDVGNARAAADSSEYAASSAPPDAGRRRAAAAAAAAPPAAARAEAARSGSGGGGGGSGGGGKRAALIGIAALVGIMLVVAVLTSSVELDIGGGADDAANATAGSPGAAVPAPEPAPGQIPPPPPEPPLP